MTSNKITMCLAQLERRQPPVYNICVAVGVSNYRSVNLVIYEVPTTNGVVIYGIRPGMIRPFFSCRQDHCFFFIENGVKKYDSILLKYLVLQARQKLLLHEKGRINIFLYYSKYFTKIQFLYKELKKFKNLNIIDVKVF